MIKPLSFKNLFKKDIKTICLTIGGFYAIFGIFATIIIKMQTMMIPDLGDKSNEAFFNSMNVLHEIWSVYMPLLILLGLGYALFGYFLNKITDKKYQINLILSVLSLLWVIAYTVSSIKYIEIFVAGIENEFEPFKYISYVFAGLGFIAVFGLFTVPQFIIGKRIKKQQYEN